MSDLHYIQNQILIKLLFAEGLSFSELNPSLDIESNKLAFHIGKLVEYDLVSKDKSDKYKLTTKGKEFANRIDTDSGLMKKQGKRSVIQCCVRDINSEPELLIYTRLKQPYFGKKGFPSGKVWFGEKPADASQRELEEETSLVGTDPELIMIEQHLVSDQSTGYILEDKYFYFYRYFNPSGDVVDGEEGEFRWIKYSDLSEYLIDAIESKERMMYIVKRILDNDLVMTFNTLEYTTDNF